MATKLGEKIRKLRKDKRLTLDALAKEAGISKSYLWELENRDTATSPSASKLHSLASVLGVSSSFLLDESNAEPSNQQVEEAFFRNYRELSDEDKERLRKIAEAFKGSA